jgi:hypothetical protein
VFPRGGRPVVRNRADRGLAPPLQRGNGLFGHLHIPNTTLIDGVRFEEVSLGYPDDRSESWHPLHDRVDGVDPAAALRQVLPVPV